MENVDNHVDNNFIEKKKGSAKFSFSFIYKGDTFGVWTDFFEGKMYVSKDYEKTSPYIFAVTLKDHSENTMFFKSARKYSCWKNFIQNFELGNIRFENQKIKSIVQNVLKQLMAR